jgi:hypothetical protein
MAARTVSNCPEQILRAEIQFKLEEESGQVTLRWIPGNGTAAR